MSMRLINIKLSGFKSFVDLTTVPFPSNLVAIVGPNGCGKSNIIDAVRWVMGESSAKHLRGESITDVIFNGSTGRQPVGQASIELNFDNSDGSLGGEYAKYAEISIRRTVSRDGQSTYYLNGTRCRRRDITDIFLGTGLGPRSYSIIEQGTISRLIEAKPEELRIYLEEAAGISKYKERRRETELRIQHTRDNLNRLNDIREELNKQLSHLQRQANAAERYKSLKNEERVLKAQLQVLRWQELNVQIKLSENFIREHEVHFEAHIAQQRSLDASIEKQRESLTELHEKYNEIQGRYYQMGAEIARLEGSIQHNRERRQQLQDDLAHVEQAWEEAQQHLQDDQQQIAELTLRIETLTPESELAAAQAEEANSTLLIAEQAMRDWQTDWDEFNQQSANATQQAQIEQARIQHLEQRMQATKQRIERLEEEQTRLQNALQQDDIHALEQSVVELQAQHEELQQVLESLLEQITQQRDFNHTKTNDLDAARSQLQGLRGRQASLTALQQAALAKRGDAVTSWLKQHQLEGKPNLAQQLRVESGWETAVEIALGPQLQAVCVNGMQDLLTALQDLNNGNLTLVDTDLLSQANHHVPTAQSLLSKVQAPWSLTALLGGIYIAESLADAWSLLPNLATHESVITKQGIWLGKGWVRIAREVDATAGVLQRARELEEVEAAIEQAELLVEEHQQTLSNGREKLTDLEQQRENQQRQLTALGAKQADCRAQMRVKQGRVEQLQQRLTQIAQELQEYQQQIAQDQEELVNARSIWQEALVVMEQQTKLRDELQAAREQHRQVLDNARQQSRTLRDNAHQLALQLQSSITQLNSLQQSSQRMQKQLENLVERRQLLQRSLAEADLPLDDMTVQLEHALNVRLEVEKELTVARQAVENLEQNLRELEKQRHAAEQAAQDTRNQLEQKRMEWQGVEVRCKTIQEQLLEAGQDFETIQREMPPEANEQAWEEQLQLTTSRIDRLGSINLAAIEEFATQSERKVYLDAQNTDLEEALATLESAIRKIDAETRIRFKETFEKVNSGFQNLFPRIFGGGNAYLELTGEDLLDTGVAVMARPPGKRNSTIHLLSGGEKALTAVALVFAIFQLNPAPFCMLDEVDAPLDDANVGRFCNLLQEMAQQIQFIFISHNKLTMEIAQHLTGVTMHEPGVSRLVAVDIDEAVALAAA